jgi:hypothetical protein
VALAQGSSAAAEEEASGRIEEIVVTAQKRSASIQDTAQADQRITTIRPRTLGVRLRTRFD